MGSVFRDQSWELRVLDLGKYRWAPEVASWTCTLPSVAAEQTTFSLDATCSCAFAVSGSVFAFSKQD